MEQQPKAQSRFSSMLTGAGTKAIMFSRLVWLGPGLPSETACGAVGD